jgi:hypothetical protein
MTLPQSFCPLTGRIRAWNPFAAYIPAMLIPLFRVNETYIYVYNADAPGRCGCETCTENQAYFYLKYGKER